MSKNPKQKGGAFERKICKELSLWISHGEHEDIFWRSAMSGGRSTVALKKGLKLKAQSGDVSAISSLGFKFTERFLIECKHYKNLEFAGLLRNRGKLLIFWQKAVVEAVNHSKLPILIAKQNNYPTVIVLCSGGMEAFKLKYKTFNLVVPSYDMYIMTFDRFRKLKLRGKNVKKRKRLDG